MSASDATFSNSLLARISRLSQIRLIVERFGLTTLRPSLEACEALAGNMDAPLDVAVFGQFKSGKSSLLNTLLGSELLPVGVVPVTAIVTRVAAGPSLAASVTRQDGSVEPIAPGTIADFVSELRNPERTKVSGTFIKGS